MRLFRVAIAAFHTGDDGVVDADQPLIPDLTGRESGQQGFRNALQRACTKAGVDLGGHFDEEMINRFTPHDLRRSLATDLVWKDVERARVKRTLGHAAGDDVLGRHYTVDDPALRPAMRVAEAIQADLDEVLPGGVMIVAAGVAVSSLGLLDTEVPRSSVRLVGELALAVVLFGDAARIDLGALRREGGLPVRLLLVGLPLSVLLGTAVVLGPLPGVGLVAAALVAAALAPTDPALGHAVVEDTSVPLRVRQALNVESGLNEGLVLPFVLILVALAGGTTDGQGPWLLLLSQQIGLGAFVGISVGGLGALVLRRSARAGWVDGSTFSSRRSRSPCPRSARRRPWAAPASCRRSSRGWCSAG